MSRFKPELFIDIGKTYAFFTLRETYEHISYGKNERGEAYVRDIEIRSFHHFNLAQDPDEAYAKAVEAGGAMGLPMRSTREGIEKELREIKRAGAAEMERRAAEQAARQAEWAAEREARALEWAAQDADMIEHFRYPFGEHRGKEFGEEIGFANWIVGKRDEFEAASIMRKIADRIINAWPEIVMPKADPAKHTGTVGKREVFNGTVVSVRTVETPNSMFGRYMDITNMVTDDGALLVCFGKFDADVGEKVSIKATVKEHNEYKGAAQTIINRAVTVGPEREWIVRDWAGRMEGAERVMAANAKDAMKAAIKAVMKRDGENARINFRDVIRADDFANY